MRFQHKLIFGLLLTLAVCPTWAQAQKMAIPSYFNPGPLWSKMGTAAHGVGLVVLNPNSGPGDAVQAGFAAQVKAMKARGIMVLGYVHTSYGKRNFQDVQTEIANYYSWYHVDGIFFDEVTNDDPSIPYYAQCRDAARDRHSKAIVAINPGTPVTEGYMKVADIVLTFESDYKAYVKRASDDAWVAKYPTKRFWHLVYATPDVAAMRNAVALSKKRHAGWLYVTPDDLPNPWDTLPSGSYWTGELAALKK